MLILKRPQRTRYANKPPLHKKLIKTQNKKDFGLSKKTRLKKGKRKKGIAYICIQYL